MSAVAERGSSISVSQKPNSPALRVLHVTSSLDAGGVETWLLRLARLQSAPLSIDNSSGLFCQGHMAAGIPLVSAILVLGETDGSLAPEFRRLGITVFRLPGQAALPRFWALRRFLCQTGPWDIVHSHVFRHSLLVQLAAFACRVSLRITHAHHAAAETPAGRWPLRNLGSQAIGYLLRQASHEIVACSCAAADSLFGPGAGYRYSFVSLPCGVDELSFRLHIGPGDARALRGREGIPPGALVLGHVGRFVAEKGHERLLRAAAIALSFQPNLYFLLIGDGPLRQAMEGLALSLGIHQRIQFMGNRQDVPRLLQGAMDGFVFPSLQEGLGVAAVEAQAAELPCLLSGAIPHEANIFPQRNRCFAPDADPASLAEALLQFASSLPGRTMRDASDLPPGLPARYRLSHNAHVLTSLYQRVHPGSQSCPEVHRYEQPA